MQQAPAAGTAPLCGLRVTELGGEIAAAYATKLLADLGASVTKIEPPGGDPLRNYGPKPVSGTARGSGLFQYLNAGKQSVVVALERSDETDQRRRLAAAFSVTDIIVESLGPGVFERVLENAGLAVPECVTVRISAFGQSGPYRDVPSSSLVVQAAGGWVARIGTPEGPPYFVGTRLEEYVTGAYAAAAALTALRHRESAAGDGAGRRGADDLRAHADVSTFECMIATLPYPMLQKLTFDRLGFPTPQRYQPIPGILACRDGFVGISALTGQHWADVCALLELPELALKMREVTLRGEEWRTFLAKAEPFLAERSASEIVELCQAMRVPAVPIGDGRNLQTLEPLRSRGFFVEQPEAGFARPRSPFRMSASPAVMPAPSPRLGERTEELLAANTTVSAAPGRQSLRSASLPARPTDSGARAWGGGRPGLPFSGLKVLDLTSFWAGPYLTMYLASFGADVLKVESPKRPDGFRFVAAFPQLGERWWEQSPVYHAANLGKRGLALDLDRSEGRALLERLLCDADIVAENYSPRVMEGFGFGYEAIRALNPRSIMLRMPGFGLDGPCRDWVGWALTFEQMAGCANVTGAEGGRMFAPGGFADPVVGMHAAVAVQAALAHRERSGEGQLIEVAQIEVVAAMTAEQVIRYEISSEVLTRTGNRSPMSAPQGVYRSHGDDEWLALSVRSNEEWRALSRMIADPYFAADPQLDDLAYRIARHDFIDARIQAWSASLPAKEAASRLRAGGVPAAAVLGTSGMYGEPQLEARHYFQTLEHPVCGSLRYPCWPMHFGFAPDEPHACAAPTLGQHGTEILGHVLGVTREEIQRLRASRVIADTMEEPGGSS
jgi:crotonobetainyl-CoA:carnitine CoA-transferase CaiB-like acyl-CoA transferase